MKPITNKEAEEMRKRCEASASGPWAILRFWPNFVVHADRQKLWMGGSSDEQMDKKRFAHPIIEAKYSYSEFKHRPKKENAIRTALFIAHARTDLPRLLDERDQLLKFTKILARYSCKHPSQATAQTDFKFCGDCATCKARAYLRAIKAEEIHLRQSRKRKLEARCWAKIDQARAEEIHLEQAREIEEK